MTTVRVLVDHTGEWMAGDIVNDAPIGLVHMAEWGTKHAATGKLLAEIVSDPEFAIISKEVAILNELTDKANSLGIENAESLSITELISTISKAEFELLEKEKAEADLLEKQKVDKETVNAAELAELKDKAKELKVPGYTKMSAGELIVAIQAVGGGKGAE
jgi:hypothetical protein